MNILADKTLWCMLVFLILCSNIRGQEQFRIMFYNAENLYDIKDNPKTNDDEFTPEGKLHWNGHRYWKKLHDVSKVITSVGEGMPPALVGLCEVENDSVLYDLTKKAALNRHKYEYLISSSKDSRGSNVALLYQRDQIKILSQREYTPDLGEDRVTRNILHITGKIVNGSILDIFVCHFPSRNEGIKKTKPYRIACAELLRQKADSLFRIRKSANIIIMGDFNDYPSDESLSTVLRAKGISDLVVAKELYNMFFHLSIGKDGGSYKYKGKWNYIDQFIISGTLLEAKQKLHIKDKKANVYKAEFLLEKDNSKYGGEKPFRTYSGWKYLGGFSDHLPIYMDLIIKE